MADRLLALLGLSAVLALAPVAANAQDGCAAELERLQQDVETAELSDEDRTKYESLMKGAVSLRDNGDDENCLLVVEQIRREIGVYPETDDGGATIDSAD